MGRSWVIVGMVWLAGAAGARAQEEESDDGRDREARGLFIAGQAAYDRAEFETALEHFERAYALSQRPELLFNVGLAAQRARAHERAVEAFRGYLDAVPDAPNRRDVEARLEEIELARRAAPEPAPAPEPEPALPVSPAGGDDGPGALPWVVIGASAAVAIGGAVLFAVAQSDIAAVEDAAPDTDWSEVSDAYDRAPTFSAIGIAMIGIGLAGATVGVVLLTGDDGQAEVAIGPASLALRGRF